MKKIVYILLAMFILFSFGFVGCSDNSQQSDDSWKHKQWDNMNREEKGKAYDYIHDKVDNAGWIY